MRTIQTACVLAVVSAIGAVSPLVAAAQAPYRSPIDDRVPLLAQLSVTTAGHRCDAIANLRWQSDTSDGTRIIADCYGGDSHVLRLVPDEKSKIRLFKYRFEYVEAVR